MVIVSILILILILGVLITVHELGHFVTAKLTGVKVNEFAIGMGPKIFKRQKGETLYSLRAFPIGGFCAMEGEDDNSIPDPRAFGNRPLWARFLVLFAGSAMNFVIGFLIMIIVTMGAQGFRDNVLVYTAPEFEQAYGGEHGLMEGDEILSINDHPIWVSNDINMFLALGEGHPFDFEVLRNGKKIEIENLPMEKKLQGTDGKLRYGLQFGQFVEATFGKRMEQAWLNTINFARIVKVSIGELIAGRAGLDQLQGPVGMGNMVNEVVQDAEQQPAERVYSILILAGLLAVNLAVMNLLPLPALDGGRILFLLIELIRRKKINPKIEGYVHAAGFVLFIGLMVFIFYNDIARLVT